jgi:hypothetical protein
MVAGEKLPRFFGRRAGVGISLLVSLLVTTARGGAAYITPFCRKRRCTRSACLSFAMVGLLFMMFKWLPDTDIGAVMSGWAQS